MHVKILSLLAVVAATMMALAGSASADYVSTTTGGAAETPTIEVVAENGHFVVKGPNVTITCAVAAHYAVIAHGPGSDILSQLSVLVWSGCTNFWHVTTEAAGSLSVESTSGHNGTVTSTGAKIRTTRLGVNCVYETNNTHFGTLTGGNPATLHVKATVPIVASESAEICGTTSTWEGSLVTKSALYVANS